MISCGIGTLHNAALLVFAGAPPCLSECRSKSEFQSYAEEGQLLTHYAHILELLLRLRQACDHPLLVLKSGKATASHLSNLVQEYVSNSLKRSQQLRSSQLSSDIIRWVMSLPAPALIQYFTRSLEDSECGLCFEPLNDGVIAACGHVFCRSCINDYIAASSEECPVCRRRIETSEYISVPVVESTSEGRLDSMREQSSNSDGSSPTAFTSSAKVNALLSELNKLAAEDPTVKSIVFSQWTSMLDIIANALKRSGVFVVFSLLTGVCRDSILFTRLDGTMTHAQRDHAMDRFQNDPFCRVFLISMKAGGLGLNLVSASTVFLMDPWWNRMFRGVTSF